MLLVFRRLPDSNSPYSSLCVPTVHEPQGIRTRGDSKEGMPVIARPKTSGGARRTSAAGPGDEEEAVRRRGGQDYACRRCKRVRCSDLRRPPR